VVGGVVSILLIILVTYFAKKTIDKEMKEQKELRRAEKRKKHIVNNDTKDAFLV
jgi:hypothetical protein